VRREAFLIDPHREREVADLLGAGTLSGRGIVRQTGISRGTVWAMANGTRPLDLSAAAREARQSTGQGPTAEGRCGHCGRLVMLPCRACQVRKALAEARRRPGAWGPDEPLTIALKDEDLARYEMVRSHKIAELQREMLAPDAPEELEMAEPTGAELSEIDSEEDNQ